jgi:hypothetical protein
MPFYYGKRSAGICVVLGPKVAAASHLGGAHKLGATYSSHRAPSMYSFGKERVLARLGWAGVIGYTSGFLGTCRLTVSPACANMTLLIRRVAHLRPRIYQQLLRLATKDYSDRLLGSESRPSLPLY